MATSLGALLGGTAMWWRMGGAAPEGAPAPATAAGPGPHEHQGTAAAKAADKAPAKPLYRCPMHPSITSDHPGDCPICGMKLVLVTDAPETKVAASETSVQGQAPVTIDPARQQIIGLRTAPVVQGTISDTWRTVGRVEVDPTRVRRVNVKVEGYVERVFVGFVGQRVRKGEALLTFYSPSLLSAQNEYLLALATQRKLAAAQALGSNGDELVQAARRKLELWDVPAEELARLEKTGEPSKTLTLVSPSAGVVTAKAIVEGSRLNVGDTPYEITDLGMVWVMADAYEADLQRARVGATAHLTVKSLPGMRFTGRVQFVEPVIDPKTRTTKVHLHFANKGGELKPDMYGEVELEGKATKGLSIPSDAVIRSGTKDIVFVSLGDGKFAPREVHTGLQGGGTTQITGGLSAGEEVVSRANFLIDSESRLRASLAAMGSK